MCYSVQRSVNKGLSLPPACEYRYPPPPPLVEDAVFVVARFMEDDVLAPPMGLPSAEWIPDAVEPSVHEESLFVKGRVAVYVSRGRAFRGPAPPPPLPPLEHGAGGVSPA